MPEIDQALDVFNNKSIFGKHKQLKNDKYDKITPNKWYPLTWKIITKAELQKGGMLWRLKDLIPTSLLFSNKALVDSKRRNVKK